MAIQGRRFERLRPTLRRVRPDEYRTIAERFGQTFETFRWKYLHNPWTDGPPVFVQWSGGKLLGAIGWIRLQVNGSDGPVDIVVPGDTAVPDHHDGLGRSLIDRSLARLAQRGVVLAVAAPLPSETPTPGIQDWHTTGPVETQVHLRRPSTLIPNIEPIDPLVRGVLSGMVRLNRSVRSWHRTVEPDPTDVQRSDAVPGRAIDLLATTEGVGTVRRSRRFWRWRCRDPRARVRSYRRFRHGEADLAAVTVTTQRDRTSILGLDGSADSPQARAALLAAILEETAGADLVHVPDVSIPEGAQERLGVFNSREWPLSLLVSEPPQQVRVLDADRSDRVPGWIPPLGVAERSL